jgi:hypothetical protein
LKKLLLATATAAILGLSIGAYAQTNPTPPSTTPPVSQTPAGNNEMHSRLMQRLDKRLARAKAELKLSPDQEKLWAPVEAEIRKNAEARFDRWQKWKSERMAEKGQRKKPDQIERLRRTADRLAGRATRLRAMADAGAPLYATLSDEQKETARDILRKHRQRDEWRGRGGGREESHSRRGARDEWRGRGREREESRDRRGERDDWRGHRRNEQSMHGGRRYNDDD